MSDECRVYWGHSGCDLPRGHDDNQGIRVHVQLDPKNSATPDSAFLFGADLTKEERNRVEELWG